MAYVLVHTFLGGTKAQWTASIDVVHPSREVLPKGMMVHYAGPSAGGWTIVGVCDSKANWERFRDDVLTPAMSKGISGGFTSPPQEIAFEAEVEIHAK
ncbi:MAG: hypothetical protein ABI186_00485 [Candidatus Elarobacter sp.]